MRKTNISCWMPDSENGGDIILVLDKDRIMVTVQRGMSDWLGCTKAAVFCIALADVPEFTQGLLELAKPKEPREESEV